VKPAHTAVEVVDALEVRWEQPLAIEELQTFDIPGLVKYAHNAPVS
jgi:hypothetical protein